jgi:hypothetical protein
VGGRDLTQEVFLRVSRTRIPAAEDGHVSVWLFSSRQEPRAGLPPQSRAAPRSRQRWLTKRHDPRPRMSAWPSTRRGITPGA